MKVDLAECPECGGEGCVPSVVGSYYDALQEQWYPNEIMIRCPVCGGEGTAVIAVDLEVEHDSQ